MDESRYFYLCNGEVIRNIKELSSSLKKMDDEVFKYHCNKEKNDFYNWINDVFADKKLAKSIARIKTKKTMIAKLKNKK